MESLAKRGAASFKPDVVPSPKPTTLRARRPNCRDVRSFFLLLQNEWLRLFDPSLLPLRARLSASYVPPSVSHASMQLHARREREIRRGAVVDDIRSFFPMMLETPWPQEILAEESFNDRMRALRFYAQLLCRETEVQVVRFWQPCRECVIVRWSLKLRPRVLYHMYGTTFQLDGVSELKLDGHGRIYQHSVDITDRHRIKFDLNFQQFARNALRKATTPVALT